jgi:hypothetical protein
LRDKIMMQWLNMCALQLLAWIAVSIPASAAGAAPDTTHNFTFAGPEIYPIERNISLMQAADVNLDGLMDLVVANNDRSRLTLLINRTGQPQRSATASALKKDEPNELPPDARFELVSTASERRLSSMVISDLNGDQLPDWVSFGEPKELVVQYNQGSNRWSAPLKWPIPDGQLGLNALAVGDLNGDQLPDLLLLGESAVHFLAQKADRTFAEPERIPFSEVIRAIQVVDINHDGRKDFLTVNWESAYPFRLRFQDQKGQLGPEVFFKLNPIRSYWVDDLKGDGQMELVAISHSSGRAQLFKFAQQDGALLSGDLRQGQFQVLPLTRTSRSSRGITWADINQDQRLDLLVSEPDSGQISLFLQNAQGSLHSARTFPCLTGVTEIRAEDWDGDGVTELFLLSGDERQIGWTRLTPQGRLPFPTILPTEGRPLAMATGLGTNSTSRVLGAILDQDGQRTLWIKTATGQAQTQKLSPQFKSNPNAMIFHDVDQDGLMDVVVVIPYEKIKILRQVPDKPYEEIDLAPPGGANEQQPWIGQCDVDGDGRMELLYPQKNFLRALVLQPQEKSLDPGKTNGGWTFFVKEQINGMNSQSRIQGIDVLPGLNGGSNQLVLLDIDQKALTLCERDASGVWQPVRNLPLPLTDFGRVQSLALGGRQTNCVCLIGVNAVATLEFGGKVWDLAEMDSYETTIKEGRLTDVVSGDLDQDGLRDLVFLETAKNRVELVKFLASGQMDPVLNWRVFEERTFRGRRGEGLEPREAIVADFTGDGRQDLALLVHDRILLYP